MKTLAMPLRFIWKNASIDMMIQDHFAAFAGAHQYQYNEV